MVELSLGAAVTQNIVRLPKRERGDVADVPLGTILPGGAFVGPSYLSCPNILFLSCSRGKLNEDIQQLIHRLYS
jgi:hypothetical protein